MSVHKIILAAHLNGLYCRYGAIILSRPNCLFKMEEVFALLFMLIRTIYSFSDNTCILFLNEVSSLKSCNLNKEGMLPFEGFFLNICMMAWKMLHMKF